MAKDAQGHGSDAHSTGVNDVGQPKYWATISRKDGRKAFESGPHPSREHAEAAGRAALPSYPNAKGFSTGYGTFGGHFDIRHESKYGRY